MHILIFVCIMSVYKHMYMCVHTNIHIERNKEREF